MVIDEVIMRVRIEGKVLDIVRFYVFFFSLVIIGRF